MGTVAKAYKYLSPSSKQKTELVYPLEGESLPHEGQDGQLLANQHPQKPTVAG